MSAILTTIAILLLPVFMMRDGRVGLVSSIFAFAFLPDNYKVAPAVIMFAAWGLAGALKSPSSRFIDSPSPARLNSVRGPLIFLAAAILAVATVAGADPEASWQWSFIAFSCAIVPFLIDLRRRQPVWAIIAVAGAITVIVATGFAIIEATTGYNPWRFIYAQSVLSRTWSVTRVLVGFSHPLIVMVFAVTIGSVSVARLVMTRRLLWILPSVASFVLLWLSVTRSGLVALGIGLAIGVLPYGLSLKARGRLLSIIALAAGGLAVYFVATSSTFQFRNDSVDGAGSLVYRSQTYGTILEAIQSHWLLGVGPGAAQSFMSGTWTPNIESSILQLALGVGVPMAGFILSVLILLIARALKNGHYDAAAGMAAFLVGMATWNALDTNPELLCLLGFLVLGCRQKPAPPARTDPSIEGMNRRVSYID